MIKRDEMDADELLDHVARRCAAVGIAFTDDHRRFLKELLYVITLQQKNAQRTGEPVPATLDLLKAWNDRFDRVAADDPTDLFDDLQSLAETIEMADNADARPSLSPRVRQQVSQMRTEALELLDRCKAEIRAMTARRLLRK